MPKICVIVPVYGVEKYLRNCLNSLLSQTEKDYEILLINDGSIDGSSDICNEYAENFKNKFRLINQPNAGLSAARNTGLDNSDSELVTFVDSDDTTHSNYLSKLRASIQNNNSDLSCCNFYKIFEQTNKIEKKHIFRSKNLTSSIKNDKTLLFDISPSACGKMYKRNLLTHLRFPNIKYEDLATGPKIIISAKTISFVKDALYFYTIRPGSIMGSTQSNSDILKAINEISEYTKQTGTFENLKNELCFLFIKHALIYRSIQEWPDLNYVKEVYNYGKNNFPEWGNNKYLMKEIEKTKSSLEMLYNYGPYAFKAYRKMKG